jgi:hypothetical protein
MNRLAVTISVVLLAWPLPALAGEEKPQPAGSPAARTTMHEIFAAMSYLLPVSVDEERFSSPKEREAITAKLTLLARSIDALQGHAWDRDAGFRYLSRSLGEDIEEARMRYARGQYEEARYFLIGSIQNCIACHSKRPSTRAYPFAEKLTAQVEIESLLPHERAQLYIATRRFSEALKTWEALFADPTVPLTQMDLAGAFRDYLTVSIRVNHDLARPQTAFAKLLQREDVPHYLRQHFIAWRDSLKELQGSFEKPPSVDHGRALSDQAAKLGVWPSDSAGLVYDLVASSLLNQFIEDSMALPPEQQPREQIAEALYLMGVIDGRSLDSYWVPQAENYLEAAIRMAPGTPVAKKAYSVLEENVVHGYGGFSEEHLPADIWAMLNTLRALADVDQRE